LTPVPTTNIQKTPELANLQIGKTINPANFIASTIQEIEMMIPLLQNLKQQNRNPNILYGIPLVPSSVPHLAKAAKTLGPNSLTVMIDHPDQIPYLETLSTQAGHAICVFLKVDTGYHRAGLPPVSLNKTGLLQKLTCAEEAGRARLLGLYSHSSLSYSGTNPQQAMGYLIAEIRGCKDALEKNIHLLPERDLVISVGATPQVVSSQNLLRDEADCAEARELKGLLRDTNVELHAGVYPLLDVQQFSTHASAVSGALEDECAISVLAEVCSVYNDGEREKPEALLAVGTLALGREPCASYAGWGVVNSWRVDGLDKGSVERLIVERISQEHGIVTWEGASQRKIPTSIGQVVKVHPNHACVTGAFYGWYFVVDSDQDGEAARIVDVWVRAKGCGMRAW
jgi:D-serine deaminase-like pyridoxal phosphate-dependent protein